MKIKLFNPKQFLLILFSILIFIFINEMISKSKIHEPKNGFVPNKETAELVAEAILVQIYKREIIEKQKPFKTLLNSNDIWVIKGSIPNLNKNEIYIGGTFYIEIQKKDCKVLKVTHGK